jgi:Restriction alleviation protein Lar
MKSFEQPPLPTYDDSAILKQLLPCPFCGKGESQIRRSQYWTGNSYSLLSAMIQHGCDEGERFCSTTVQTRAETVEEAVTKWNSRVGAYA